jgi:hypothetical protein
MCLFPEIPSDEQADNTNADRLGGGIRKGPDKTEGAPNGGAFDSAASGAHNATSGREGHGPGGRNDVC